MLGTTCEGGHTGTVRLGWMKVILIIMLMTPLAFERSSFLKRRTYAQSMAICYC